MVRVGSAAVVPAVIAIPTVAPVPAIVSITAVPAPAPPPSACVPFFRLAFAVRVVVSCRCAEIILAGIRKDVNVVLLFNCSRFRC